MKKADLYLIKGSAFSELVNFCCRLSEKALSHNHKIHIQTAEAYQNEAINEALWSYKPESFLPHTIGQHRYQDYPITIDVHSLSAQNEGHRDLLILLSTQLPSNYASFNRMSILVANNADSIQSARETYKALKSQGIEVMIHDLRN